MNHRSTTSFIAVTMTVALAAVGLSACSSTSSEPTDSPAPTTSYQPGTRSTAQSHPANPVISKLTYVTKGNSNTVVAPITTSPGGSKDEASATVIVYPTMTSRQRMPKPIYVKKQAIEVGKSVNAQFVLPPKIMSIVNKNNPVVSDQLVEVSVSQRVDGDSDGTFEGSLNARTSYHDSQVHTAGETVDLTIGTNVANVNVATTPIICMYNDSSSNFAPLNASLANAGDYVSSSIEADGDLFDSPQYGGPPWSEITTALVGDAAIDIARAIVGALSGVNIAIQAVIDIISIGVDDCESQASIFQVTAASPTSGDTTNQAYVASEQTSNGLLSAQTALQWQLNMQEQGGTVWQESISNQYLQQMAGASTDNGLSVAATNNSVGDLTLSSSWTFMIDQGGTSSIPNGCDDKGC